MQKQLHHQQQIVQMQQLTINSMIIINVFLTYYTLYV